MTGLTEVALSTPLAVLTPCAVDVWHVAASNDGPLYFDVEPFPAGWIGRDRGHDAQSSQDFGHRIGV